MSSGIKLENDAELVQKFKETQNRLYFEQLYDRHASIVFRKCWSYLDSKEDAEDASQVVWVKVFFALQKFEQKSSFSTWLYRITSNHCINQLKNKRYFASLDELSATGFEVEDDQEDFLTTLSNTNQVTKALSMLSKDMKALFLLKYLDEYTYEEIALVTGLGESAIKMRIARAKQQIQSALSK